MATTTQAVRDIRFDAKTAAQDVTQTTKGMERQLTALAARLPKLWAPAASGAAAVGKAIENGLRLPLALAQKGVEGLRKAFAGLFGMQLQQAFAGIGSAILSAFGAAGQLHTAIAHLQTGFAQMLSPIVQALTPALAALANGLATVLAYAGRLFSFLTGKAVKGADAAAGAVANAGTAAGRTAKKAAAAARTLTAFDELERLGAPKTGGTAAGSGGGSTAAATAPAPGWVASSPFLDQLLAAIEGGDYGRVGTLLAKKLGDTLSGIPWDGIQATAKKWALDLTDALNAFLAAPDVWATVGRTLGEGLDTALLFLSTALQNFDWAAFGRSAALLFNNAVGAISWAEAGQGISALAIGLLTALQTFLLTADWQQVGEAIGLVLANIDWPTLLSAAAGAIGAAMQALLELDLPLPLLAAFAAALCGVSDAGGRWEAMNATVGRTAGLFTAGLSPAVLLAGTAVAGLIAQGGQLCRNWEDVSAQGQTLWQGIQTVWGGICAWFDGTVVQPLARLWGSFAAALGAVWGGITAAFTTAWGGVSGWFGANVVAPLTALWQRFSATVSGVWTGLRDTVRGVINGIIGFVNGLIGGVAGGINAIVWGFNHLRVDVPAWVPGMGGKTLGFDLPTVSLPQIPYLAQGAVIPANREFLAVLGDQPHGTNVEAPLAVIEQAVANVMDRNADLLTAMAEYIVNAIEHKDTAVYIGDDAIGRAAARYQRHQAIMRGGAY